jgi:hypothetical protein
MGFNSRIYGMLVFFACALSKSMYVQISPDEAKKVVGAFVSLETVRSTGVTIAGTKFFTLQANERSIYGKKMVCHSLLILIVAVEYIHSRQTVS